MFAALKKFLVSPAAQPIQSVTDPVLGELRLSEDADWWEGNITIGGESIGFKIAGESVPDAMRIAHAHDIVRSFPEFREMIRKFLDDEARNVRHLQRFVDEIRQLQIEDVCLLRPRRPDDGMVYFRGPDPYRLWRCDYVD
jgi:hypothetical protein